MPYCLSCGKLRDTVNGMCLQCRADEALRRTHAAHKPAKHQKPNMESRKENDNGKSKGR